MSDIQKSCDVCHAQLPANSAFCLNCGAPVAQVQAALPPETPQPAAPALPAVAPPQAMPVPQQAAPTLPVAIPQRSSNGIALFVVGVLLGLVLGGGITAALFMAAKPKDTPELSMNFHRDQKTQPVQQHVDSEDELPARETQEPADDTDPVSGTADETHIIEYDKADAQQVMAYLVYTIFQDQPWMIRDLVGGDGCSFAPYATEAETPGYNNAEDIAVEMEQALVDSDATCLGYGVVENGLPDKATMYWLGLRFDWERLGLGDYAADVTAFEFFKIDDEWRLSYITPVPDDLVPEGDELLTCPFDFIPAVE